MTHSNVELEVEVFRGGDYGPKGSYGEADLDRIAAGYDPATHEAPVTLDHAQRGPAHGCVKRLRRLGDRLLATLWKVSPALHDWLRRGAYRKCSVELYRSFRGNGRPYLKAVSFLGAATPEVKGLQAPLFAEVTAEDQKSQIVAENAIAGDDATEATAVTFLHESRNGDVLPHDLRENEAGEPSDPGACVQDCESRGKPSEKSRLAVAAALAALRRSGHLIPAWDRAGLAAFTECLLDAGERDVEFTRDGEPHGCTLVDWFLEFLRSLPRQIDFGELVQPGDEDFAEARSHWSDGVPTPSPRAALCARSLDLHRRTVQFMAEHPEVRYADALNRIARR